MENIQKKRDEILENYRSIEDNISNIENDIQSLDSLHKKLLAHDENKMEFNTYGFYIDDIFFHKKYLNVQYRNILLTKDMTFRKMYGDLFRLYVRVTKKIYNLDSDVYSKKYNYINKFFTEPKITKFMETSSQNKYSYTDLNKLFETLIIDIELIKEFVLDIANQVKIMEEKNKSGYEMNAYVIGLIGRKNRLEVEIMTYNKTLEIILQTHYKLSERQKKYSLFIADELKANQDHYNSISEQILSYSKEAKTQERKNTLETPLSIKKTNSLFAKKINFSSTPSSIPTTPILASTNSFLPTIATPVSPNTKEQSPTIINNINNTHIQIDPEKNKEPTTEIQMITTDKQPTQEPIV